MAKRTVLGSSAGITLLEITAALFIILLLAVFTIPAMNLFRSQSIVKDCAWTVNSILLEARAMAIAQNTNFTVRIDAVEESMQIFLGSPNPPDLNDNNVDPLTKKWLAPAAVDIQLTLNKPRLQTTFKPDGGATAALSIFLKRRDALDTDTSKYYTVTITTVPGTPRIYSKKHTSS